MTKTRLFFAEVTVTNKWKLSLDTCSCSFQRLGILHPPPSAALPVTASLGADPHSLQGGQTHKQLCEIQLKGVEGMERLCRHPIPLPTPRINLQ